MSYSLILAEIKTILEAITGIVDVAEVHDYQRYSGNYTRLKDLFVTDNKFHWWEITRDSALNGQPTGSAGGLGSQIFRNHNFLLNGYFGVDDENESEKTFQALADTVMDTFNTSTNRLLSGEADIIIPAQLLVFEAIRYPPGSEVVLCHHAQIQIQSNEDVSC